MIWKVRYLFCGHLFMMSEPLTVWRHLEVTKRQRKQEFAQQMQTAVDSHYPDAVSIQVVMDNLNTHQLYALYEHFPSEEARRLFSKLEFRFY